MYTFPELVKKIREETGLTQAEFAKAVDVSAVLIAMIETGQKEVSKSFLLKLARSMKVHPVSITPFLFVEKNKKTKPLSGMEHSLIRWGEKMQIFLIKNKAKNISKYANKKKVS